MKDKKYQEKKYVSELIIFNIMKLFVANKILKKRSNIKNELVTGKSQKVQTGTDTICSS